MLSQTLRPVLDLLPGKPRGANMAALGTDGDCTGLHHMGQASLLPDEEDTGTRRFKRVGNAAMHTPGKCSLMWLKTSPLL